MTANRHIAMIARDNKHDNKKLELLAWTDDNR